MAWLTAANSTNKITQSVKKLAVYLYASTGGVLDTYTATRTITTDRYVGMTQAAAETAAGTFSGTANVTDAHTERGSAAGDYDVIVVTTTTTAFALVTS